jgi:hypothetical protein
MAKGILGTRLQPSASAHEALHSRRFAAVSNFPCGRRASASFLGGWYQVYVEKVAFRIRIKKEPPVETVSGQVKRLQ